MHRVTVRLNRQQLELLDRTLASGLAPDRAALLKLALREFGPRARAAVPQLPPRREPAP
jgi:hypothetical protein